MAFWKKLFKRTQPPDPGQPTVEELVPEKAEDTPAPTGIHALEEIVETSQETKLDLQISLQSDVGSVRTNNEDRGVYKRPTDPAVASKKGTLIVIADGMGGASAGEVASDMATRLVPELYYSSPLAPALALKEALEKASSEIYLTAQSNKDLKGMGTTCVAVAILVPDLFVAYVGDSRLYLVREGGIYQLTEDHTLVAEMVRKGLLTPDQARVHEDRSILSLSMGGRPEVTASFWEKPMAVRDGDRLLVSSDGLHDLVSDAEMQTIIENSPGFLAAQQLIDAAKRHGGHDNITAALVHVCVLPAQKMQTEFKATREFSVFIE